MTSGKRGAKKKKKKKGRIALTHPNAKFTTLYFDQERELGGSVAPRQPRYQALAIATSSSAAMGRAATDGAGGAISTGAEVAGRIAQEGAATTDESAAKSSVKEKTATGARMASGDIEQII